MNRKNITQELESLSATKWDIIVIGGGATGLGIAVDSATRGYKILLLEQSDFAKGTSSRSTKLVHGGVRYMAQGDLLLVMEACRERGVLLKNAPHLTYNQEFVIPVYSYFDVLKYTAGLKFYDLLAGRLSMGKSYFLNREKTLARLPLLKADGLKGGIVYHDGQFDDSRLAITLAGACVRNGGYLLNYCTVTGFLKEGGKISGVKATNNASGREYSFNSDLVINATGVFADKIAVMDDPGSTPSIRPSQGVHLVLDRSFLGGSSAIMIPKTDDGRVLFAIPWYDEVVVGTTDTPLNEVSLEPKALGKEIDFILKTAGDYLVRKPERKDVLCIFAGLRPLAADNNNKGNTKEVSRRHRITVSRSGLLSIVGGKWTTYRMMAEETIDTAINKGFLEKRECVTRDLRLDTEDVSTTDRLHVYGRGAAEIQKLIAENPELGIRIVPALPYTRAEIVWICRNEMPFNLEDILARRTRALFLNARASIQMASETAAIMAAELGNDTEWQQKQIMEYTQLALNYT
ncbi:MAG TPA: glycerol-3-phosphate dehydrogenase/oxidase [Bacteroidales bacterium]|nr:glycerol-3-phosphate dehydrogenase/oxidase [Bacteroidales bacterium]